MEVNILNLPEEIFTCTASELWKHCPPLSLYRIPGKKSPPLILSIILHGNEDGGLLALQNLLAEFGTYFPRETYLLIGNSLAARDHLRHLDDQPDFNRLWHETGPYPEQQLAHDYLDLFRSLNPFAVVDIHNNSGKNPHYICINKKELNFFKMARLFEGPTIFFDDPPEVLTIATSQFAPSTTVECGLPHDLAGARRASEFIKRIFDLENWSSTQSSEQFNYYEVVAKISIPYPVSFGVGEGHEQVILEPTLEDLNFKDIEEPTHFATIKGKSLNEMIYVSNREGKDLTTSFVTSQGSQIFLRPGVTPSMLTLNHKVTEQDVLGYLMKKRAFTASPESNSESTSGLA